MALQRALLLQRVFPSPRPEGESSQMLLLGLTAAIESPGSARTGTSGSPWGNPASPPPGLEQDEGWEQLMSGRLSPRIAKWGCCWYLRTPTFTAGFLQRHQILGHSSRAQPASLVVSPSLRPWTVPRHLWRGCSAVGGSEIHDRRFPSPSGECHL